MLQLAKIVKDVGCIDEVIFYKDRFRIEEFLFGWIDQAFRALDQKSH